MEQEKPEIKHLGGRCRRSSCFRFLWIISTSVKWVVCLQALYKKRLKAGCVCLLGRPGNLGCVTKFCPLTVNANDFLLLFVINVLSSASPVTLSERFSPSLPFMRFLQNKNNHLYIGTFQAKSLNVQQHAKVNSRISAHDQERYFTIKATQLHLNEQEIILKNTFTQSSCVFLYTITTISLIIITQLTHPHAWILN